MTDTWPYYCPRCDIDCVNVGGLSSHKRVCMEPVYCPCETSDYDVIDQCRNCLRPDARAPRVAAAIAKVAALYPQSKRSA